MRCVLTFLKGLNLKNILLIWPFNKEKITINLCEVFVNSKWHIKCAISKD
jgi:hypothetical protein